MTEVIQLPAVRKKLGIVVCPNKDWFHGENVLFVAYLMYTRYDGGVRIIDEPTYQATLKILKYYEELREVEVVYHTCLHCKRRGAR